MCLQILKQHAHQAVGKAGHGLEKATVAMDESEIGRLHAFACRFCAGSDAILTAIMQNGEYPPGTQCSYATQAFTGQEGAKALQSAFRAIENVTAKPINGVSTFCEKCHRISILPYAYYAQTGDVDTVEHAAPRDDIVRLDSLEYYVSIAQAFHRQGWLCASE